MKFTKNQISAQTTLLAASIFIGSNSFVLAATPTDTTINTALSRTPPSIGAQPTSATGTTKTNAKSVTSQAGVASVGSPSNVSTPAGATTSANGTAGTATSVTTSTGTTPNGTVVPTNSATVNTSTNAAPKDSSANAANSSTTSSSAANSSDSSNTSSSSTATNTKWRPGRELTIGTDTQDLVPTDDIELAKKQAEAYPDSPEAAFIYAVALTRTSQVEVALQEVKTARKLAEAKGGATYFDKMIATYEEMLKNYPKENRVRYGLAWAYYMKAYLLANYSRKVAKWKLANPDPAKALADAANGTTGATPATPAVATTPAVAPPSVHKNALAARAAAISAVKSGKPMDMQTLMTQVAMGNAPKIREFTDGVEAKDIPQIHKYFEQALTKLDELIAQKPDDVWALLYRAHLKAEYSGNIDEAMATWKACSEKFPNNPASYFFLGEGWLKKGDMKQSVQNASKAIALRGMGF